MKDTEEVRLTVRLPRAVADALRALAAQHDRSLNGEIVQALRRWVPVDEQVRRMGRAIDYPFAPLIDHPYAQELIENERARIEREGITWRPIDDYRSPDR